MEQYLMDSNAISYYLSASLTSKGTYFIDSVIDLTPNISIITQIELLCWKATPAIEQGVAGFIGDCNVFAITGPIINDCIMLRRSRKINTPDAIIAATALANKFTLITSNERDFLNIKGLKLINPQKL